MKNKLQGRLTLPEKVRVEEQDYINQRRNAAQLENQELSPPVGLALSGGGIRSATFALGVLQKFAKHNSLRLVDYMTTVSGGGYIGSCISSLMSSPQPDTPSDVDDTSIDQSAFSNFNLSDNFPLVRADQMHHLRKHGNFLILREGVFRKDVLRAVGLFLVGIISTFFLLALPLLTIVGLSIAYISWVGEIPLTTKKLTCIPWSSWSDALAVNSHHFCVLLWGFLIGITLTYLITLIHSRWKHPGGNLGETDEDLVERTCLTRVFVAYYFVAGILLTYLISINLPPPQTYFTLSNFLVPVFFSLGNVAGAVFFYSVILSKFRKLWTLKRRSLSGATIAIMFNATVLFFFLAFVALCIWAVLGKHLGPKGLDIYDATETPPGMFFLILSALSFITTRLFALRGKAPKSNSGPLAILASKLPLLTLQIAVPLFLFCTFMVCIEWVINYGHISTPEVGLCLAVISAIVLLAAGYIIDVNRLSIHYFYRDRLTETYLQTERHESGELKLIREDSDMTIGELNPSDNDKKNPFPYHIILCALNLAGSRDLARRTRKSDHFIFSRKYCGSSSTGYVPTNVYRRGTTKLATAMAISGAAASSNMGFQTSFARAFAMTLFNVRLGYWLVNPRVYDRECDETTQEEVIQFPVQKKPKTKWIDENWKHKRLPFCPKALEKRTWWPWFLRAEMMSDTNSQSRFVNLSDGGHTGDNIGLYPLFQRRCQLIIASDAECDPGYSFSSLINVINQIYIDENVEVEIDITKLRPDQDSGPGKAHFLIGKINYPEDPDRNDKDAEPSTGWLIYLKSSLIHNYYQSTRNEAHHQHNDLKHEPPAVQSYAIHHKDFPHETTADQFFDDDQFEAYRALGFHVAASMLDSFENWRKKEPPEKTEPESAATVEEFVKWCESQFHKPTKVPQGEHKH
ncbi:patatin-like phospholipase family protein [uncultured Gimesia sp.]|uniref:patatin-like phospholipase family protein n=1 Tax=uncultured Gimesia sp. TaxID=1678688 RepID=UPI0030DBC8F1|tara:strand:- start:18061 stop:20802 length:2742 start_codon:yes stop_codon:yes gene_type:complete